MIHIRMIDADGSELWNWGTFAPGGFIRMQPECFSVHSSGAVPVTGGDISVYSFGKIASDGDEIFSDSIGSVATFGLQGLWYPCIDDDGNMYAEVALPSGATQILYLYSWDPDGNFRWSTALNAAIIEPVFGARCNGSRIFAMYKLASGGREIACLDQDGNILGTRSYTTSLGRPSVYGAFCINADGNAAVVTDDPDPVTNSANQIGTLEILDDSCSLVSSSNLSQYRGNYTGVNPDSITGIGVFSDGRVMCCTEQFKSASPVRRVMYDLTNDATEFAFASGITPRNLVLDGNGRFYFVKDGTGDSNVIRACDEEGNAVWEFTETIPTAGGAGNKVTVDARPGFVGILTPNPRRATGTSLEVF